MYIYNIVNEYAELIAVLKSIKLTIKLCIYC